MTYPVRVAVQIQPADTPDYATWRQAVLDAEAIGADVIFGVGAGWYEKDYTTYGFDFGTVKSRADLFDEGLLRIEHRFELLQPAPLRKIPILAAGFGRVDSDIERSTFWTGPQSADSYLTAGATLFHTEIRASEGKYDLSTLEKMVTWRDAKR